MENTFTPKHRLYIYKEAQRILSKAAYDNGICIVLGDVCYGNFYNAPWNTWRQMQPYFNELRRWALPKTGLFTPTQRREILESAIAEVTELIKSKA